MDDDRIPCLCGGGWYFNDHNQKWNHYKRSPECRLGVLVTLCILYGVSPQRLMAAA